MPLFISPLFSCLRSAMPRDPQQVMQIFMLLCVTISGSAVLTGCSSRPYTVGPTSGLPAPAPSVPGSNAYIGTQTPLNWTLTIDDNQNAYTYQSLPPDGSKP